MNLSNKFKQKVRKAILLARDNYGGSDSAYAKMLGIDPGIYSRIKKGETDQVLKEATWLSIGNKSGVSLHSAEKKVARTAVYAELENNLTTCQRHSLSMVLVDDCGIGKTFCARHIIRKMKNAFYFDCSQVQTAGEFVRELARTIGVDESGRLFDIKRNIKYCLNNLEKPLIVLDEAGDFSNDTVYILIKEFWNATETSLGENSCGWYMMGANGLEEKFKIKIRYKKSGFAELFSRFSEEFIRLIPLEKSQKQHYYRQLIGDVASVNIKDKSRVNWMINECLSNEKSLRHLDTLLKMEVA